MQHYPMLWPGTLCVNKLHTSQVMQLKARSLLLTTHFQQGRCEHHHQITLLFCDLVYDRFHCKAFVLTRLLSLFVVLVGLYEEPEKPNNALEYP